MYRSNLFATQMSKGTGYSAPPSGYFTSGKPRYALYMRLRWGAADVDRLGKSHPHPGGFDLETVQPIEESQYGPSYTESLAPQVLLPITSS